jgi:hypothetical protein
MRCMSDAMSDAPSVQSLSHQSVLPIPRHQTVQVCIKNKGNRGSRLTPEGLRPLGFTPRGTVHHGMMSWDELILPGNTPYTADISR